MRASAILVLTYAIGVAAVADCGDHADLGVGGIPWLRIVTKPHEAASHNETSKVFAHLLEFGGTEAITQGIGGAKYPHHRGLFIGWKDTLVGGTDFDTWHMTNCYQACTGTIEVPSTYAQNAAATMGLGLEWRDLDGTAFVKEKRYYVLRRLPEHPTLRICDHGSELQSLHDAIQLKGDLQHAGMQVRLHGDLAEKETAEYILPAGAVEGKDDTVTGAWWACCTAEILGKRYWVLHMTPPDHPGGRPVYSIRRYGRFGAFTEPTIEAGKTLMLWYRVIWSDMPLDQAACQALYNEYASETATR